MKKFIKSFLFAVALLYAPVCSAGIIDVSPDLTVAVAAQTAMLKDTYDKRTKLQEKILAAETTINLSMDRIHSIQDKTLKYLSEASHALANLNQIKEAALLVSVGIPDACANLADAASENATNSIFASLAADQIRNAAEDMASLYSFMTPLVNSGSYGGDSDGSKVNLLNTAERYQILTTVVSRLKDIQWQVTQLHWRIKCFAWRDLWFKLDPKTYRAYLQSKVDVGFLASQWNSL